MATTIRDVARAAGVSKKTVSRVINDEPLVRPETRERVWQAIQALDFHPNPLARSLVTKRTRTLGLIVPDISNPFFAQGIDGCVATADQQGYHLFLGSTSGGRKVRQMRALLMQRVSGVILWAITLTDATLLEAIQGVPHVCPLVFIDCSSDFPSLQQTPRHSVRVAQEYVGTLATDHLLGEGRRRVAHVRGGGWAGDRRCEGYTKALASQGIQPREQWIQNTPRTTIGEGVRAASALLAQRPLPDAIFAFNDPLAVGALLACHERKVRVPEDVAIVGVDDTEMAAITYPPLTTVRLHQYQTGVHATTLLLRLIHGTMATSRPSSPSMPTPGLPLPELVIRRSSAPRCPPEPSVADVLGPEDDRAGSVEEAAT